MGKYQICDFWKQIAWPDLNSSFVFVYSIVEVSSCGICLYAIIYQVNFFFTLCVCAFLLLLIEMVTATAIVYADLIFQRLQATGFLNEDCKISAQSEEVISYYTKNLSIKLLLCFFKQTSTFNFCRIHTKLSSINFPIRQHCHVLFLGCPNQMFRIQTFVSDPISKF